MHFHREKRRPVWGFGRAWRPLTLGNETHRNTYGHSTARHSALSWFAYFAVKLRLYSLGTGLAIFTPEIQVPPHPLCLSESKLYYRLSNLYVRLKTKFGLSLSRSMRTSRLPSDCPLPPADAKVHVARHDAKVHERHATAAPRTRASRRPRTE